jgi:hypothetical protein
VAGGIPRRSRRDLAVAVITTHLLLAVGDGVDPAAPFFPESPKKSPAAPQNWLDKLLNLC